MNDEELREKYVFEADYGDGRGFVEVVPREGAHAGWDGDISEWVKDKEGRWKGGGVKAVRVRDRATNRILAMNLIEFPGIQPVKLVSITGEYRNAPIDKAIYSNVINIGVSPSEITIDFGRMIIEKEGERTVNVGIGQVAIIMTYETAQSLRDTLDAILKAKLVGKK